MLQVAPECFVEKVASRTSAVKCVYVMTGYTGWRNVEHVCVGALPMTMSCNRQYVCVPVSA